MIILSMNTDAHNDFTNTARDPSPTAQVAQRHRGTCLENTE